MIKTMKNKSFSLLLIGNSTSILGTLMLNLALSLYVLQLTNSATQFSFVISLQLIATACLSPFAGTLVDTWNKKTTIILLDLLRGFFSLMIYWYSINHIISIEMVYLIVLFYSLTEIFFNPAFASIIPRMFNKEDLPNANALYGVIADTFYAVAPILGASLYALTGISNVLLVVGITYILSSLIEVFIQFEEERSSEFNNKKYFEDIKEGFILLFIDKRITSLFTNDVLSHLFIFPFITVGIPYVMVTTLNNSEQSYGIVQSIATIGSIASFVLLPYLMKKFSLEQNITIGLLGVSMFGFLLIPLIFDSVLYFLESNPLSSILFFGSTHFILYLSFSIYLIFYTTLYQNVLDIGKIGRFVSIETTFHSFGRFIGVLLYGFLFEKIGIYFAVYVLIIAVSLKILVHLPFLKIVKNKSTLKKAN